MNEYKLTRQDRSLPEKRQAVKTFIIAEIGVNHNGRLDLALQLVDAAAAAGAHAAKFQTFKADSITVRNAETVAYQKAATGSQDQHSMLKALELDEDEHRTVAARCRELGIEFMSTAFDSQSLDMLCDIGLRRIKIPSGEITNTPYLEACAARKLPIVLSTGMASLAEVKTAVKVVSDMQAAFDMEEPRLTVLHCTSAYPTELDDVNLLAMRTMADELQLPVGYSDHTRGIFVAPIAVAMGARIIEKHITLDRQMPGPDHSASIEPDELRSMVKAIADAEALLGNGIKEPRDIEVEARRLVRRGLKVTRDLPEGAVISASDIAILRPATGLSPSRLESVIGKRTIRPLLVGEPIEQSDIL